MLTLIATEPVMRRLLFVLLGLAVLACHPKPEDYPAAHETGDLFGKGDMVSFIRAIRMETLVSNRASRDSIAQVLSVIGGELERDSALTARGNEMAPVLYALAAEVDTRPPWLDTVAWWWRWITEAPAAPPPQRIDSLTLFEDSLDVLIKLIDSLQAAGTGQ